MAKLEKKDTFKEIVNSIISNLNGCVLNISESIGRDKCSMTIDPEVKGEDGSGTLVYNAGSYDLCTSDNLIAEVYSDGNLTIRQGDDPDFNTLLSLKISSPAQIEDLKEFIYDSSDYIDKFNCIYGDFKYYKTKMSDIIEEVFISVILNQKAYLVNLKHIFNTSTEFTKIIKGSILSKDPGLYCVDNISNLNEFGEKYRKEIEQFETFGNNKKDVILLSLNDFDAMTSNDILSLEIKIPSYVVRLKENVPYSFFVEIVKNTVINGQIKDTISEEFSLKQFLNIEFMAPKNKYDRLFYAFSVNIKEEHLRQMCDKFSDTSNCLPEKLLNNINERIKRIHQVRYDFENINKYLQPLPFILEYPFEYFFNSENQSSKVRASKFIVNVLCKFPLFILLEELRTFQDFSEITKEIENNLEVKPASDGTYLDLQQKIVDCINNNNIHLPVFSPILSIYKNGDFIKKLESLVTARNRSSHAPFDDEGLLKTMDENIKEIINSLRDCFKNIRMLCQPVIKIKDGNITVSAKNLSGASISFPSYKINNIVKEDFFNIDSERIFFYNESSNKLCLSIKMFRPKNIKLESVDIGLYDRTVNIKDQFTFVRESIG